VTGGEGTSHYEPAWREDANRIAREFLSGGMGTAKHPEYEPAQKRLARATLDALAALDAAEREVGRLRKEVERLREFVLCPVRHGNGGGVVGGVVSDRCPTCGSPVWRDGES